MQEKQEPWEQPLEDPTRARSAQAPPVCWPCKWMCGARFPLAGLHGTVGGTSKVASGCALCLCSLLGSIIWRPSDHMGWLAFFLPGVWPWMNSFNSPRLTFPTSTPGIKKSYLVYLTDLFWERKEVNVCIFPCTLFKTIQMEGNIDKSMPKRS